MSIYIIVCFGSTEQATQVLGAFHTNRTVTELRIREIHNLEGAALGHCLSGLLHHKTHPRTLACSSLMEAGVSALQPGLRSNQQLKELSLVLCRIGDKGLHLLLDSLVGNTTLEELDVTLNDFTSNGRCDAVMRLLECTKLRSIGLDPISAGGAFWQRLLHTLHRNTTIESISHVHLYSAECIFARNRSLRRTNSLLALQPRTRLPIPSKSGLWYKAIMTLGRETSGTSAIFDIFQKRPALLERQLQQPQQATSQGRRAAVEQEHADLDHDDDRHKSSGRKRARLS